MYENLFYSIVGCHAGENIKEIIERKQKEILASGISLWSAKIDKMSKKLYGNFLSPLKSLFYASSQKVPRTLLWGTLILHENMYMQKVK